MFAEATLKGIVDERIWRYDNATYFRLEVAARPRKAGEPVHWTLPKNVLRSMPHPSRADPFVSVSAMPRLREMDESLATFIKNAVGLDKIITELSLKRQWGTP